MTKLKVDTMEKKLDVEDACYSPTDLIDYSQIDLLISKIN